MLQLRKDFSNPALLFSGGADSTLIYCLYAMERYPIKLYVLDRYNKPVDKAISLYESLRIRFEHTSSELIVLDMPKMHTTEQVGHAFNSLLKFHDAVIFSGNLYPDDETIRPKFKGSLISTEMFDNRPEIYAPLMKFDKSEIIKLYYEYSLDDILPMTHSCGSNGDVPCGECFNCRERIWAYNKLNIPVQMGI